MNYFYEYKDEKVSEVNYEEGDKIPLKGKKLYSLIKNGKNFSKHEVFFISKQLLEILDKMRSVFPPIVHKNINISNIIVKKDLEIALIGFNKEVKDSRYTAPEVLNNPTPKCDLYSVGKVIKKISTINDKNFRKFISLMIDEDPNQRFDNTKVAKDILIRIIEDRIIESDWNLSENRKKTIDDFGLKLVGNISYSRNDNFGNYYAGTHNSTISAVDAYAEIHSQDNKDSNAKVTIKDYDPRDYITSNDYEPPTSPFMKALMIVGVAVIIFFVKQVFFEKVDEYMPCDPAPVGYYNDEDCNIILMNEENRKEAYEIARKRRIASEKRDAEIRKKFKKSGLGKKY